MKGFETNPKIDKVTFEQIKKRVTNESKPLGFWAIFRHGHKMYFYYAPEDKNFYRFEGFGKIKSNSHLLPISSLEELEEEGDVYFIED